MHSAHASTDVGLLLSLAAALPDPSCALARKAAKIARRLASRPSRDLRSIREAADVLADLLIETDAGLAVGWDADLLDEDFDS